jgi:hypothetical protein
MAKGQLRKRARSGETTKASASTYEQGNEYA